MSLPPLNDWVALLIVIPLVAGLLSLVVINSRFWSRAIGVTSILLTLGLALGLLLHLTANDGAVLVSEMGDWKAPFGIALIYDSLSGILVTAAMATALAAYLHSFSSLDPGVERRYFHPLFQFLLVGVNLSFVTGDLFNLFVGYEVMLMASYALLTIGSGKAQLRQAYKYVLLNVLAGTILLMSAGMTYGMFGTLNMADLARIIAEIEADPTRELPAGFTALSVMLLLVFAVKGAFFPLWFWLPDTYYTLPIAIGGLFGGLLTKVGVYTIVRLFPGVFASDGAGGSSDVIAVVLAVTAGVTMFLGVLGAVSQHRVRKILAVHVISQVGYMAAGIAVAVWVDRGAVLGGQVTGRTIAAFAIGGCVFHMVHNIIVKCALFLCCGLMEKHAGTDDLDKLGGLLKRDVFLAVLFFIAAMSLVGFPPLSGFGGKIVIIQAGWSNLWVLSVLGLLTGALTLLSMLKIWSYGFWNPDQAPVARQPSHVKATNRSAYLGVALLVAIALFLGFGSEAVYEIAFNAGDQIADRTAYIEAVLGPEGIANLDGPATVEPSATTQPAEVLP
ncbi:MAG: proton-conducting transporter membrane subunit [Planctomycetota bacterium]